MHNFNVLIEDHCLRAPHFLEASAGTGKTFAIEHLVTRFLLDPVLKALPEEVLVVTFTRAATRELRIRVRANIKQGLRYLQGDKTVSIDYLEATIQNEAMRQQAIKKLQEALNFFDRMSIFTIHGFCQAMLKKYPFEALIPLEGSFEEGASQSKARCLVTDFLRSGLDPKLFHRSQVERVFRKHQKDIEKLTYALVSLIAKEAIFPDYKSYEEGINALQKSFSIQQREKTFFDEFEELTKVFNGLASSKHRKVFLEQLAILTELAEDKGSKKLWERLLQSEELFLEKLTPAYLKKKTKVSFETLEAAYSLIRLQQQIYPLLEEMRDERKIFVRMAKRCKELFFCKEEGLDSPDALLKAMQKGLERPAFCKKVQLSYKAAIVDEFQDTDPLQWDIFYKLFYENREGFPLYLVGDPKQSIYAFRNADLPTYLKASRCFLPEQHYSLDVNYRSEPCLINTLNRLFSLAPEWLSKTFAYEKVKPKPQSILRTIDDGFGSFHLCLIEEKLSKSSEEEILFPFVVEEILKLHEKGFSFNSFALLIRDRFQGQRLLTLFKKAGIPLQADQMVQLVETKAFSFLRQLIKTFGDIQDRHEIQKLLVHPFMGFSYHELKLSDPSPRVCRGIMQLKALEKLYQEEGFLVFWEAFLKTSFLEEESSFEEKLVGLDHAEGYYDLTQIVEKILEKEKGFSSLSLETLLEDLAQASFEDKEDFKRQESGEEEAVTLMTMHKSKGLEFDIVFALGVAVRTSSLEEFIKNQEEQKLVVVDRKQEEHHRLLLVREEEKLRQLYVAFTRAKKRVYCPLFLGGEELKELEISPIELFMQRVGLPLQKNLLEAEIRKLAWEGLTLRQLRPQAVAQYEQKKHLFEWVEPKVYRRQFSPLYVASYSSSLQQAEGETKSFTKLQGEPGIPSSAYVGNLLHKILEKVFERGLYKREDTEALRALAAQEIGMSSLKPWERDIIELLEKVLLLQLRDGDKVFSLKDIEPSYVTTEMEFWLFEEGNPYKGVMDLFFHYQGKYYLIDWKSNWLGEGREAYDQEGLRRCMQENHYFMQAQLYGKALQAYLKRLKLDPEAYGGIFYIFLRGVEPFTTQGIYTVL